MKTFIQRRKILEAIPEETFYCYTPISKMGLMDNGKYGYKIKPCKFYKGGKGLFGKCNLYNMEVVDQVKICKLRE